MKHIKKNASLIFEHIVLDEADADDVEVLGFETNKVLQPEIWNEDFKMRKDVSSKLLKITKDFVSGIPFDINVKDLRLTGSLAAYNWSKFSDVDLHLVVDFSEVDEDVDLVKDYFNSKKTVWNLKHEIYIYNFEVEIYVENTDDNHTAQGIYSVLDEEWIKKPTIEDSEIQEEDVKKKAASVMSQIEYVEDISLEDPAEAEKLAERIKEKIRKMRRAGLDSKKGVYSVKNVAFKVLRRNGYLQRLSDVKTQSYDRVMSLANI